MPQPEPIVRLPLSVANEAMNCVLHDIYQLKLHKDWYESQRLIRDVLAPLDAAIREAQQRAGRESE